MKKIKYLILAFALTTLTTNAELLPKQEKRGDPFFITAMLLEITNPSTINPKFNIAQPGLKNYLESLVNRFNFIPEKSNMNIQDMIKKLEYRNVKNTPPETIPPLPIKRPPSLNETVSQKPDAKFIKEKCTDVVKKGKGLCSDGKGNMLGMNFKGTTFCIEQNGKHELEGTCGNFTGACGYMEGMPKSYYSTAVRKPKETDSQFIKRQKQNPDISKNKGNCVVALSHKNLVTMYGKYSHKSFCGKPIEIIYKGKPIQAIIQSTGLSSNSTIDMTGPCFKKLGIPEGEKGRTIFGLTISTRKTK